MDSRSRKARFIKEAVRTGDRTESLRACWVERMPVRRAQDAKSATPVSFSFGWSVSLQETVLAKSSPSKTESAMPIHSNLFHAVDWLFFLHYTYNLWSIYWRLHLY